MSSNHHIHPLSLTPRFPNPAVLPQCRLSAQGASEPGSRPSRGGGTVDEFVSSDSYRGPLRPPTPAMSGVPRGWVGQRQSRILPVFISTTLHQTATIHPTRNYCRSPTRKPSRMGFGARPFSDSSTQSLHTLSYVPLGVKMIAEDP